MEKQNTYQNLNSLNSGTAIGQNRCAMFCEFSFRLWFPDELFIC